MSSQEFIPPTRQVYTRLLNRLHEQHIFDWYMEIGCRTGTSFQNVRGKTIAVDPFFRVQSNVIHQKPELHIFQKTSDDFFASGFLKAMKIKISFAFLDGMHLFEFLLRDFINTEANCAAGSVIALHDCVPFNTAITTRDLDNLPRGAWAGDVWKLIPILQKYRPDLQIDVVDCRPTGLVLVSNLAPRSRVLKDNYQEIVKEWTNVEIESYGIGKFFDSFEYVFPRHIVDKTVDPFKACAMAKDEHTVPEFVTP